VPEAANESLIQAVDSVLETMFFAVPDGPGDPAALNAADTFGAWLTFTGHTTGRLSVTVSGPAARLLAADFLGTDPQSVSDVHVTEVICELANMICGSVVSQLEGEGLIRLTPASPIPAPVPHHKKSGEYAVELIGGVLVAAFQRGGTNG
jgi:CheY-specific phosphatase CheX